MTLLEQKVDAIARIVLGSDPEKANEARQELRALMAEVRPEKSVQMRIVEILTELGVTESLCGYNRLVYAIACAVEEPGLIEEIIKSLYPMVAKKFCVSASMAERTMRFAIERTFTYGDRDVITKYFGGTISPEKGKATNGEFIAKIAGIVRREREAGLL